MSLNEILIRAYQKPWLTARMQSLELDDILQTPRIQITTNPVDGDVLTSDAAGNGTWQSPTSIGSTVFTYSITVNGANPGELFDADQGPFDISFVKTGKSVNINIPFFETGNMNGTPGILDSSSITLDASLAASSIYNNSGVSVISTIYDGGDVPNNMFPTVGVAAVFDGLTCFLEYYVQTSASGNFSGDSSQILALQPICITYSTD